MMVMSDFTVAPQANSTTTPLALVASQATGQSRRLTDQDRAAVTAFFLALDHSSRYSRFCEIMTDAALVRYVGTIDFAKSIVLGTVNAGGLVAIVELLPYQTVPTTGEVALCLALCAQSQGLGGTVLRDAVCRARDFGLDRLVLTYSAANVRMQALITQLRLQSRCQGHGCATGTMPCVRVEMAQLAESLPALASDALELTAVVQLS
jgi:RimJ/RimL family protein N-acetyltransferase